MANDSQETRTKSMRKPLGDGTQRANLNTTPKRSSKSQATSSPNGSILPHHESLLSNGPLTVRNVTGSPDDKRHSSAENKRLSAITNEDQPDSKRSSQASTVSNASGRATRRKTHIGPWQLGRDIGQGASCKVRKVRHSVTGQQAAVKIISKKIAEKGRSESLAHLHEMSKKPDAGALAAVGNVMPFGIEREVVILKLLEHPNVVRLYDVWENRDQLYLIMEFVDGGELFDYVADHQYLFEDETVWLFRQMVAALLHCHRLGIHHRDLKPENILVETTDNSLRVKLADFGMAALQPKGKQLTTACGSVHYAAPEVFEKRYDGSKVDVWSLGIILYVMLTGTTPFTYDQNTMANNVGLWYTVIKSGEFPLPDELSDEAKDLVKKMLHPNPRHRPSLEAVWNHSFIHKYEEEWGEDEDSGKLENWIGPQPIIENWNITCKANVDREILRNLRTLWHSEKEEVLLERILSKEPNQEKYFYSALQRHREEQLENYVGNPDAVACSTSDYHYIKPTDHHGEISPVPKKMAPRTQSQFSILNDEHLQSRNSILEPPTSAKSSAKGSVRSYDPFRASRDAMVNGSENYTNIILHRRRSQGSRRSATNSLRNPGSLRVEAIKNTQRRHSTVSSSASLRHSSPSAPKKATSDRRSMSKTSLSSTLYPSSPPGAVRPNIKHKRAVQFPHRRQSSTASASASRKSLRDTHTSDGQKMKSNNSIPVVESKSASDMSCIHVAKLRRAEKNEEMPRSGLRKSQTTSQVIESEARKVSTELEKLCEEVFNRSSDASSHRTSATMSQGPSDTPPSTVSNSRSPDSVHESAQVSRTKAPQTPSQRPLPSTPEETPNTYIARELAETSKRLADRYAEDTTAQNGHYFEVLAHLEHLNSLLKTSALTTSTLERRITSAPEPKLSEFSSNLPVISEDKLLDTVSHQHRRQPSSRATEPLHRVSDSRFRNAGATTTIRAVDTSSPPRPAPLVIRKASKDSMSAQSSTAESTQSRCGNPYPQQVNAPRKVTPTSPSSLDTISEESAPKWSALSEAGPTAPKKKRWWNRKHDGDMVNATKPKRDQRPSVEGENMGEACEGQTSKVNVSSGPKADEVFMSRALRADGSGMHGKRPGFLRFFTRKNPSRQVKGPTNGEQDMRKFSSSALSPTASTYKEKHSLEPIERYDSRDLGVQRNWLARFLHIKPATKILCFQATRGRIRSELIRMLKSWRPHGIRDVLLDRERNLVFGRLDAVNALGIKEVEFVAELYVVLEKGKKRGLSIARFTQRKGAASSFKRVVDEIENRLTGKGMMIMDADMKKEMESVLNEGLIR